MKFCFGLLLALLPSLAFAQQGGVLQSGTVTPGHPGKWIFDKTIGDAGGANNGSLTDVGITNTGTPFCINDAPITAPGGYHQLCLGANSLGGGLLSYNAHGPALALPMQCNINGVSGPCLTSGNVSGPGASTVNHIVTWGNTSGTFIKDGAPGQMVDSKTAAITAAASTLGVFSVPGITTTSINQIVGFPEGNFDAFSSLVVAQPGGTLPNTSAVGAYARNQNPTAFNVGQNALDFYGAISCEVNNAACWGINTVQTDNSHRAVSALTGIFLNNEFDFNVMSPNTTIFGVSIQGSSLSQPANAFGFYCGPLDLQDTTFHILWSDCFHVADGITQVAMTIGATAQRGNNIGSAATNIGFFDATGVRRIYGVSVNTAGQYFIQGDGSFTPEVNINGGLILADGQSPIAISVGAKHSGGTNTGGEPVNFTFYDAGSVGRVYGIGVDTTGRFAFNVSAGGTPSYTFDGPLDAVSFSASGTPGVTCSGAPSGSFASVHGIVTHC